MHEIDGLAVDPNLLPVLDILLRERNVSRAAEQLGRTQSAISHALARLRQQLGDPLLVRVGQRFVLTPRATALQAPLRALLGQLQTLLRPPAAFEPATARHTFRIVATDYLAALIVPQLLAQLQSDAPGIDLRVVPPPPNLAHALAEGQVDFGLAVRLPSEPGVRVRKLYNDRFVCLLRRGHPDAHDLNLAAFLRLPHVLVAPGSNPGGFVDNALAALGHTRRVALMVPHFLLAPALLAATDLVLTLPERLAHIVVHRDSLCIAPLPLKLPSFAISLAWHERAHHDPADRWMRAQMIASACEPPKKRSA